MKFKCFLSLSLITISSAFSSVYRADLADQTLIDLGNNQGMFSPGAYPNFSGTAAVVNADGANFGSSVLIADRWMLSAAHVFVDEDNPYPNLTNAAAYFGESFHSPTEVIAIKSVIIPDRYTQLLINPDTAEKIDDYGLDIALVELAAPAASNYARAEWAGDSSLYSEGSPIFVAGYGDYGTGLSGPIYPGGIKRAVTNTMDRILPQGPERNGGYPAIEGGLLALDFDTPSDDTNSLMIGPSTEPELRDQFLEGLSNPVPTDYEGVPAPGDSGGPLFLYLNEEWVVAGISSYSAQDDELYGDIAVYTQVSPFDGWISANIPEPKYYATVLGLCMIGLAGWRRRTTH